MIRKQTGLLQNWAPMPRYLLRRFLVRDAVRKLKPQDFIEIGSGTGDLAKWMHDRGMAGTVTEISPLALQMLQERFEGTDVQIHAGDVDSLDVRADLLLCMEVLEHVEDDNSMLRQFFDRIRPGGHLIVSVPAHQRRFAEHDVLVGHLRRYERADLERQLNEAGFIHARIFCYGFPTCLFLRHVRNFKSRQRLHSDSRSSQERTQASGVERDYLWAKCVLNDVCFWPFHLMQLPFLQLDWAEAYLAIAEKPAA